MKKILIVVLEEDSATGICVKNVVKCLSDKKYSIDVLSVGLKEKDEIINDRIRIMHISPKFAIKLKEMRAIRKNRKIISISAMLYKMQVAITSLVMWPWNAPFFTVKLFSKMKMLHKEQNYAIIIPVYTQVDPIIAGYWMKRKYSEILYVPYFLDALSGGPTPRLLSTEQKIKKGLKWEKKLLSNADRIVVMQSSAEHHKRYSSEMAYYSNMRFLDIPMLLEPKKIDNFNEKKENANKIILTYLGSMPLSIRNPYYALNLLREFDNIEVRFIGNMPDSEEYRRFCTSIKQVKLISSIPHENISQYIYETDILINIGNNIAEMVPSKIFEYMSYGKPILSFSPNLNDPSIEYLKRYPNACIINESNNRSQNKNIISEFLNCATKRSVSFEEVRKEFYLNTPECFAEFISSLEGGK